MLALGLLAATLSAHAQAWPDVTADLPASSAGRGDAAVLVGVSDYVFIADVPGAVDNVTDWRRYLVRQGVPLSSIKLLSNGDATRESILREAEWAADRVERGGKVWFVYVGHGAPAPDGRDGLLVGADAQGSAMSLEARSARRSEVLDALAGGDQAETVVVLDACFSGKSDGTAMLAEGLQPVIPTALATVRVATVLSAGQSDQFAGPLPGLGRPAFSYLTLGAMRGWGDANGDGQVTATEAVEYAGGALSALLTDRRQEPEVTGEHPDLVLGTGRDGGPDLLAIADSLVDRGPVRSVVDAGGGASSVDVGDLEARIRERECQAAADAEAVRLRDAQLRREGTRLESTLSSRWSTLQSTSERCAAIDDEALRLECRDAVATFLGEVSAHSTVRVTAGEHEVSTDCGTRRGLAPEAELSVARDLRSEVTAFIAEYNDDGSRGSNGGPTWSGPSGYEMVRVPAGSFTMGSPASERDRDDDEVQHRVTLTRDLYVGRFEVTQGLWQAVMGDNPSATREQYWSGETRGACRAYSGVSLVGDDLPVMCIDWNDAVGFANALSRRDGLSAAYRISGSTVTPVPGSDGYRLPTEAEWEYFARGGESAVYGTARNEGSACRYGNVADATAKGRWDSWTVFSCTDGVAGLATVGRFDANAFGLHDTLGNVWEWTSDWYGAYPAGSATDPTGPQSGSNRVIRGGSWNAYPRIARVANRYWNVPGNRYNGLGLRLVRTIP